MDRGKTSMGEEKGQESLRVEQGCKNRGWQVKEGLIRMTK